MTEEELAVNTADNEETGTAAPDEKTESAIDSYEDEQSAEDDIQND